MYRSTAYFSALFLCVLFCPSLNLAMQGANCFGANPMQFSFSGIDTAYPKFFFGNPAARSDLWGKQVMPVNFTVAFIGDSAAGTNANSVLNLIKDNSAHMTIHSGDFDYVDSPASWDALVTSVLGADYPYFESIGNHDCARWTVAGGYQELLYERLQRIGANVSCLGEVDMVCSYKGLVFVLSSYGTSEPACYNFCTGCPTTLGQAQFIEKAFAAYPSVWRVCSWHKNHHLLQIGTKGTEVSLPIYDACRKAGAIISTGHEHSYARTHQMSSFQNFYTNVSTDGMIHINEGNTVAWVSGVAGYDLRTADPTLASSAWWAATSASGGTTTVAAGYGALFCKFNLNGDYRKSLCEMKTVDGRILDSFVMQSDIPDVLSPASSSETQTTVCTSGSDIELQVASGTANAVQTAAGSVTCSAASLVAGPGYTLGFTFLNVNLTSTSQIRSAYLEVAEEVELGGALNWTIRAELGPGAAFVCPSTNSLSSRTKTVGSVSWTSSSIDRWYEAGIYKSPDLSTLISEVIQSSSWAPMSSINVYISVESSSTQRTLNSFNRDRCQAATLSISYSSPNPVFCSSYTIPTEVRNALLPPVAAPTNPPQTPAPVAEPSVAAPVTSPVLEPQAVPMESAPLLAPRAAPTSLAPIDSPVTAPTAQPLMAPSTTTTPTSVPRAATPIKSPTAVKIAPTTAVSAAAVSFVSFVLATCLLLIASVYRL